MKESQVSRRLRKIMHGLFVVAALAVIVVLLPALLPIALACDAWEMRRLARSKCPRCGTTIGMSEIHRAKREAHTSARATIDKILAQGGIPRVVAVWKVMCPGCAREFSYRTDARQRGLVST